MYYKKIFCLSLKKARSKKKKKKMQQGLHFFKVDGQICQKMLCYVGIDIDGVKDLQKVFKDVLHRYQSLSIYV